MKRIGNLIPLISDPDNLRLAFWKARKGREYSYEVQLYRQHLHVNLQGLATDIRSGKVRVGDYRYFRIFDPKEREICACVFGEHVLHHALMNVCHEYFERKQIVDSYASRPGKGTHAALARAQYFSRRFAWYLKLDVRKFFASIHHEVLKNQLADMYKDPTLLIVFDQIIDSYQHNVLRGVPIGNLSSQYVANHYLCGLDHFIKEELRIRGYVRYMDDMVLWHSRKSVLKQALAEVERYLADHLRMKLKPPQINRCRQGLPFLGYRVFPHHIRLTQRSKQRFVRRMRETEAAFQCGTIEEDTYQRKLQALLAFLSHADSGCFRKDVILHFNGCAS